ncbi:hypothetical protein [Lacihabitans lacunae]|uniref:Lipoprotein n=1 Tax=Lacihabitans lacunae TaxID=1028214 RepID=A0ABV7YTT4_9BACT
MNKLKNSIVFVSFGAVLIFAQSCRTDEGNEKLQNVGQKVGVSASKVVKGVKSGIEKAVKINIGLSESLKNRGVSCGRVELGNEGGRHNKLSVYMIFDKAINRNVTVKVVDNQGLEVGRCKALLKGAAGDTKYVDFVFDKRTNIDRDFVITME